MNYTRIFGLVNPITNKIFYISATSEPLGKKLRQIIYNSMKSDYLSPRSNIAKFRYGIRKILAKGQIPSIKIIETWPFINHLDVEKRINHYINIYNPSFQNSSFVPLTGLKGKTMEELKDQKDTIPNKELLLKRYPKRAADLNELMVKRHKENEAQKTLSYKELVIPQHNDIKIDIIADQAKQENFTL